MRMIPILAIMLASVMQGYSRQGHHGSRQPLQVFVTFPSRSDTVDLPRIRIAGHTDPAATVFINEKITRVYPHGAFVGNVDLTPLSNQITIRAEKEGQEISKALFIYRSPEPRAYPEMPSFIDHKSMTPREKTWLYPGDCLTVQFQASPGGSAYLSVEKINKHIPMIEQTLNGIRGFYSAAVRIKDGPCNRPLSMHVYLKGKDGQMIFAQVPGKLFIMSEELPVIGLVTKNTTLFPAEGSAVPIGHLTDSIKVQIIGRVKNKLKVKLGESRVAFCDTANFKILPSGSSIPLTPISAPVITSDRDWCYLAMDISTIVPFVLQHSTELNQIELLVFGAFQTSSWMNLSDNTTEIERIQLSQPGENLFSLKVDIKNKQQWGYRAYYEKKKLTLAVRRAPKIAEPPNSAVKNLVFTIDPGHGGSNEGTLSPTGIKEKDVNLLWSLALADLLRQAGAKVILTRSNDIDITLEQRLQVARESSSNIFISLHNNAAPASGNALTARGTGTFFTAPHSQDFAAFLYSHLLEYGLTPYGLIYNSYYVTNVTDMLAVLIEGTFLTNPEEEQLFLKGDFIKGLARAVYKGIEDFLHQVR